MQANVTFSQLWMNPSLLGFFFREQAKNTLKELLDRSAMSYDETLQRLEDSVWCDDLDAIEEDFYNSSVEELAEQFEIELQEEEED